MYRTLIVILNWNGSNDSIDCIKSLYDLDDCEYDILLIDNASKSEQLHLLEEYFSFNFNVINESFLSKKLESFYINDLIEYQHPELKAKIYFAKSLVNHGFAKGCNIGVKIANEIGYENTLLLNNDTVVEPNFLTKMLGSLLHSDAVIPQIRFYEPKNRIWNCGGSINKFGKRKYFFNGKNVDSLINNNEDFNVTFATGCCLLLKTKKFIDIGLFSEKFFFGEEDIDFSLRMLKENWNVVCNPTSIIYHKVGASLSGDEEKQLRKACVHYLNRFINMKKHLGLLWIIWLLPASLKMITNLIKINKIKFSYAIKLSLKIIYKSFKLDGVAKELFEDIIFNGTI